MQSVLDSLLEMAAIEARIIPSETLTRPGENPTMTGSFEKINQETGWSPEIPWEKTLRDLLEDWMERAR